MIKKVDKDVYRIWKQCPPHLLQVFYQEGVEMLRLKIIDHPQHDENPGLTQKVYYFKDYHYEQMPGLIRSNFTNLREIFQEIRLTSRDNFRFNPEEGLRIGLQVGSKIRHCLFILQQVEHTYLETIETMLWKAEIEVDHHQTPDQLYLYEVTQLRVMNQRHTQEIISLHERLNAERQERQKAFKNFEAITSQLHAEIYQLRMMNEASKSSESQVLKPQMRGHADLSSLICEQRVPMQVEFINIDDDSNWLSKIEQYNGVSGLAKYKFKFDANSAKDSDHSFERNRQRFTYRRRDEKHRQLTSLLPLNQPIGFVSFKLIRTKDYNIFVGAVLPERLNLQNTTRDGDAISYKLSGTGLWEDSVRSQVVIEKIQPSEVLTMLINLPRKNMQWWKFGKLLAERVLPYSFIDRPAHPFVNMMQEGDCVELV